MFNRSYVAAALFLIAAMPFTTASAAVIVITQAKANAGGVTPGDTAGFPVALAARLLPVRHQFNRARRQDWPLD